ncbi:MAG: FapA family protein, partial [Acidobacteriota bacterium]
DGGGFANFGGALVANGAIIDVSNSFRVSGDVDYHSGNISNDSGSVFVEGSLLAGFRVTAGGDVEIGRSIEGGTVDAGGELIVREAIIGKEGSTVRAVKDIRAAYVQNADLMCDGNLLVERELIQSKVKITGMLKLTGQPGAIVGGEIEADAGIVATTLGSSSGSPTMVRIGRGTRRISLLSDALIEKLEPLKQIRARLGASSPDELLNRLSGLIQTAEAEYAEVPTPALSEQISRLKERRASIRKLLRLHKELEQECAELETKLAEAEKEREKQVTNGTPACVEVRGTVFPGVVFMIDGATFPVTKMYSGVRFFYNTLKRRVEARRNF